MSGRALEYVEIDVPYCALSYGVAPCTASIPTTGAAKCFNTTATCQDLAHISLTTVTLRFARAAEFLPHEIAALPWIVGTEYTPAIVSLGVNLGQRAALKATFAEHPHSDAGPGLDKYHAERGYDPWTHGTFWGRFRVRQPYLRGASMRWINGFVGQPLAEMETRHFFIESSEGPGSDGQFSIVAKDALKFLDGDRAQAPVLSNGFLVAPIDADDAAATLSPSGIGNEEYPASGYANIGGNEIVAFSRSGNSLTLSRGQLGSVASSHSEQDRVQLVLTYSAQDVANILYDLVVNYAGVPSGYIPLVDWLSETATYLNRVYTGTIAEPTSVAALVSELIEQAALAVWDDNVAQKLRLQVLRGVVTDADRFSESNILQGTLTLGDQPEKRLSQVHVYFGLIDPTKPVTNQDNYRSSAMVIDAVADENYGAAIKRIYSRWIPQFGRTVADRLGAIQIGRFRDPPRKVSFQLVRGSVTAPAIGNGYRLEWWNIQDASGARADLPLQLTRLNPGDGIYKVDAEEMRFSAADDDDLSQRAIAIDFNSFNINLRAIHDTLFPALNSGDTVTFTIASGVVIGSTSTGAPAVDVGSWPGGVTVVVIVNGRLQGCGGVGGRGGSIASLGPVGGTAGSPGGIALYVRSAINLAVAAGAIWGGAGGGGGGAVGFGGIGGGGGGGAGTNPAGGGAGGLGGGVQPDGGPGGAGTQVAGGAGGTASSGSSGGAGGVGGAGGGPGLAGAAGANAAVSGSAGGAAGSAIDGVSHVTVTTGPGDVRGPQVN